MEQVLEFVLLPATEHGDTILVEESSKQYSPSKLKRLKDGLHLRGFLTPKSSGSILIVTEASSFFTLIILIHDT